jgi:YfiH family protein
MATAPKIDCIRPDWAAPASVRACVTTRTGGYSSGPWAGLNLADHVGDDPAAVSANRVLLRAALVLPGEPRWLHQVHGTDVLGPGQPPGCADACFSDRPGEVCVVLTADCLPVFFCDRAGTRVAVAHAGWRGLLAGVLERTVERLGVPAGEILAWLGPAIGPAVFEVGDEVREAFLAADPASAACFAAHGAGHWLADLYALARQRLAGCGIGPVGGGDLCTLSDPERFYSYRRDGVSGRMASLIWLQT